MEVKDLQPKAVFEIFDQITKIPRPSKKEEKIRKYILEFAKDRGIEAHETKSATSSCANRQPPVMKTPPQ